jgi:hypothetical protein
MFVETVTFVDAGIRTRDLCNTKQECCRTLCNGVYQRLRFIPSKHSERVRFFVMEM